MLLWALCQNTNESFSLIQALSYIAHSAMSIIFPLHLLYLHVSTPFPIRAYIRGLAVAAKNHLNKRSLTASPEVGRNTLFPVSRFLTIMTWCTFGVTIPALLWFAALPLASYVSTYWCLTHLNDSTYVVWVMLRHYGTQMLSGHTLFRSSFSITTGNLDV